MKKTAIRAAALGGVAALALSVASPGYAATVVSQASASALTLSIGGQGADSGTVTATNDGKKETVDGETNPPVDILNNQALADLGVLAQEASATVSGKDGVSRACSGVAGQGGAVVAIGDSGCITPGDSANIGIANINLSDVVTINPDSALGPLAALNPVITTLTGPITSALQDALAATPLGDLNIGGTLGAVQAVCSATPGKASGASNITDASIDATAFGQTVNLVTLPTHPEPNTTVLVGLDKVLDTVLTGVEAELTTALTGALAPLTALTSAIKTQIVDAVVAQIAPQLAPLEDNVLKITLNEQSSDKAGQINVTALDLEVLPAAQDFIGADLIQGVIGTVHCGPNAKVVTDDGNPGNGGDGNGGDGRPNNNGNGGKVPTVIDAGMSAASSPFGLGAISLVALALGGAAGVASQRRMSQR